MTGSNLSKIQCMYYFWLDLSLHADVQCFTKDRDAGGRSGGTVDAYRLERENPFGRKPSSYRCTLPGDRSANDGKFGFRRTPTVHLG